MNKNIQRFALGRYANEHWAFSHPSLLPCDTYRGSGNDPTIHKLERAPVVDRSFFMKGRYKEDWYRYKGLMFQYIYLYGQVPPSSNNNSLIYHYYKKYQNSLFPNRCQTETIQEWQEKMGFTNYPDLLAVV